MRRISYSNQPDKSFPDSQIYTTIKFAVENLGNSKGKPYEMLLCQFKFIQDCRFILGSFYI